VTAKQQLQKLLKIQDLAVGMQAARSVVAAAPLRIEEIEGQFRERNAEYVAVKDRYEALESDTRERNGELATLAETQKHYMDNLMQVKNQREYAAMLKEIDTVKASIGGHEETVLSNMTEMETLKTDLDARAAHIAEERAKVESERALVEAEAETARSAIAAAEADRAAIEAELPRDLVANVRRIEEMRQGLFLAKADKETCQSCYVRVRPQVYQEIKQAAKLHICSNCRRYLYHEPSLRAPVSSVNTEASGVEATNGG